MGKGIGEATCGATDKAGENDGCLGVGAEATPGKAENNWLANCAISDGSGAPAAWAACVSAPASRSPPPGAPLGKPPGGEPDRAQQPAQRLPGVPVDEPHGIHIDHVRCRFGRSQGEMPKTHNTRPWSPRTTPHGECGASPEAGRYNRDSGQRTYVGNSICRPRRTTGGAKRALPGPA